MLIELVLDVSQREFGTTNRNVQLGKDPRERPDVIFMAMREYDGTYSLPVLNQIRNVRDNNVHAQQLGLGKHKAGVDDDDVVTPAHGHAIHAKFAEAAKGYKVELSRGHRRTMIVAQHVYTIGRLPAVL